MKGKEINKMNLILSIVIAFAAWVYVVYNVNPTMTRTYKGINVNVAGQSELTNNGDAVSSVADGKVDVKLRARRSVLDDISAKDIQASVDVSRLKPGTNTVTVNVVVPDSVKLTSQSVSQTEVTVERRDTKTVKLIAVYGKGAAKDEEPVITSGGKEEIEISGAESLVKSVTNAEVVLDNDRVTDQEKTFRVKTCGVNSSGDKVPYIKTSPGKVKVTAIRGKLKTVKLNVKTENDDDDQYQRKVEAPDQVTIKGKSSAISKINSVDTEVIDLSQITSDKTMNIKYDLPDGIAIANASAGQKITIKVTGMGSRTFSIAPSSITVSGLASGLTGTVQNGATVTVTGANDLLNNLSTSSFVLSVSAAGLNSGSYTLTPSIKLNGPEGLSASATSVTLVISGGSSESDNSNTNNNTDNNNTN